MLGHASRNTFHIGMFTGENGQATDDWKGRATPSTHIHLHKLLLHSYHTALQLLSSQKEATAQGNS